MDDIQRRVLFLLGNEKMNAIDLCSKLNIEPDMRNELSNGEYYTAFKERIGLQITDDAEIDELIQEERSINNIPNQDFFFLTAKGKKKLQELHEVKERRTEKRWNHIAIIVAVLGLIMGIIQSCKGE